VDVNIQFLGSSLTTKHQPNLQPPRKRSVNPPRPARHFRVDLGELRESRTTIFPKETVTSFEEIGIEILFKDLLSSSLFTISVHKI